MDEERTLSPEDRMTLLQSEMIDMFADQAINRMYVLIYVLLALNIITNAAWLFYHFSR